MAFWDDVVGNIGTFLGINPDTKKRPQQVVAPQNTLRQQAVRPSLVSTGMPVDNSAAIRQQAQANNQAELDRKRREEEAQKALLAQQQALAAQAQAERQDRQIAVQPNPAAPLLSVGPDINAIRNQAVRNNQAQQRVNPPRRSNPITDIANFVGASNQAFMGGTIENIVNTANLVGAGFDADEAQKRTDSFLRDIGQKDANGESQLSKAVDRTSEAAKWGEALGQTQQTAVDMATMILPGVAVERALVNIPKVASWVDKGTKVQRFLKSMVPVVAGGTTSTVVGQIQDPTQNAGQNFAIGLVGDFAGGFVGAGLSRIIGKIKSGAPLNIKELEQLSKEADRAEMATKNIPAEQIPLNPTKLNEQAQLLDVPNTPLVDAPQIDLPPELTYKPISVKTVGRLTQGDAGAATAIIRNSGRNFHPQVERQIAEELGMAKTPEMTKAVLNKYGIPIQETPAEALARQNASGEQVVAQQADQLDSASQEVVPQEAVPTATNAPEQVAAPSADIAQNTDVFTPQVSKPRPTYKDELGVTAADINVNGKTIKGVDAGIASNLEDINNAGYKTMQSMSGLKSDYLGKGKERYSANGYMAFAKSENTNIEAIAKAAKKAGLEFQPNESTLFTPSVVVRTGITKDGTPLSKLLQDAGKTTTNTSGEFVYSPETYAARELAFKDLVKQHGGQISDAEIAKRWNIFSDELSGKTPVAPQVGKTVDVPTADGQLSKADQAKFDETFGVPKEKGAVDRAMTPKAERKPEARVPVNPAVAVTKEGTAKPLTKQGQMSDDLAPFAENLSKEGKALKGRVDDNIRPMENQARSIEQQAPGIHRTVEETRAFSEKSEAKLMVAEKKGIAEIDDAYKGLDKDQTEFTTYLVENLKKKSIVARAAKESPAELKAAKQVSAFLEKKLPEINASLELAGKKPIGTIEEYFPRMRDMAKEDSAFGRMLNNPADTGSAVGEARIDRSFMKSRTEADAVGKQLNGYDSMMKYVVQAETLIHRGPVVARINAIQAVIKATTDVPASSKDVLTKFFKNMSDQLDGSNQAKGITGAVVAKGRSITSKASILASANTILAQATAPANILLRTITDHGLLSGLKDTTKMMAYSMYALKRVGKDVDKLAVIDGMNSPYLQTVIGRLAPKRHIGARLVDTGFKASSVGDLQSRYGAVRAIYESRVAKGAPRNEATLRLAGKDVKLAMADRAAGERSRFTSSGNAANMALSHYQVEQIAQVYNFLDGVMLNKKAKGIDKFAATLAGAGAAYMTNQVTGVLSGGNVKPLPDVIGASIDAYATVQQMNEDRIANGDDPYTPAEMSGLLLSNTASSFISNLPLGRTMLSGASMIVNGLTDKEDTAKSVGLNPRDTNPFQTLPIIANAGKVVKGITDTAQGKISLGEGALTVGAAFVPGGGQIKRTVEGSTTFAKGSDSYKDETDKDTGVVTKGDTKFTVNNDLSTGEGIKNLVQAVVFGKYANKGAQDYIKSGFQTQSERDIKGKTFTAEEVLHGLNDDQAEIYGRAVEGRFTSSLEGKDKEIQRITGLKGDALKRNLENGTITQDEVDNFKVKRNQYLYDNGLGHTIDKGMTTDEFKKFTPEVQAFITKQSITGKKDFKDDATSEEAKSVISIATGENELWPTVTDVKPTNALAQKWVEYQKKLGENPDDQAAQFAARKTFWSAAVKQGFDTKSVGVYDMASDGTTNDKSTYAMSIANIKQLVSPEGLQVGGQNYRIDKPDLDAMVELDNRLLKAGLISTPKFSNKTRSGFGYGAAPASELDGVGYVPKESGSGNSKDGIRSGAGDFLTSFGGSNKTDGFKLDIGGEKQRATPKLNLAQYQNKGTKSGKSSIKIVL